MVLFVPLADYSDAIDHLPLDARNQLAARVVSSLDNSVVTSGQLCEVEEWLDVMNTGGQFVAEVSVDGLNQHGILSDVYQSIPDSEFLVVSSGAIVVTHREYGCSLYVLYKGSLTKVASVIDFECMSSEDINAIVSAKECADALRDVAHWMRKIQFFENNDKFPERVAQSVVEKAEVHRREALTRALLFIQRHTR